MDEREIDLKELLEDIITISNLPTERVINVFRELKKTDPEAYRLFKEAASVVMLALLRSELERGEKDEES